MYSSTRVRSRPVNDGMSVSSAASSIGWPRCRSRLALVSRHEPDGMNPQVVAPIHDDDVAAGIVVGHRVDDRVGQRARPQHRAHEVGAERAKVVDLQYGHHGTFLVAA